MDIEPQQLITRIQHADFYLDKPTPALLRPWAWVLITFPILSTVGLSILAFFGYGFAATTNISHAATLQLVAAGCLALGEMGSFFATVEVFRKYRRGESKWWDYAAMTISSITTVIAIVVGWAWAMGQDAAWQELVRYNSAIVMSVLAVLDTALAGSEAGMYLGEEAEETKEYQDKFAQWASEQEVILKKLSRMAIRAEEAYFRAQLEDWKAQHITAPTGYVPQAEDKVLPQKEEPEVKMETCWCGARFEAGGYSKHVLAVHAPEIAHCTNGVQARRVLRDKYGTANAGDRKFPTVKALDRWLARQK